MATYALTVSTNAIGLGVLNGARVFVERLKTTVSDLYGGQGLTKNSAATNQSGIAVFYLQPDDNTVYHKMTVFDLSGIPVYSANFSMPPLAVNFHQLPPQDIVSASAAVATQSAAVATQSASEAGTASASAIEAAYNAESFATQSENYYDSLIRSSLKAWAYAESFAVISATRNANNVITSANIKWPDGVSGVFTTDKINATFNTIDGWHATYLDTVTKTVTQTAVTRNADGAVTVQPEITIS